MILATPKRQKTLGAVMPYQCWCRKDLTELLDMNKDPETPQGGLITQMPGGCSTSYVEDQRRLYFSETHLKMDNHSMVDQLQVGDAMMPMFHAAVDRIFMDFQGSYCCHCVQCARMVNLTLETSMWATPRS